MGVVSQSCPEDITNKSHEMTTAIGMLVRMGKGHRVLPLNEELQPISGC